MNKQLIQGIWDSRWTSHSSNAKALRAVMEAMLSFSPTIKGRHVKIFSDNTTAVSYIKKLGGTRTASLMSIAEEILIWAEKNLASLVAVYLKGEQNTLADFLSREILHKTEWCLNQTIFNHLTAI